MRQAGFVSIAVAAAVAAAVASSVWSVADGYRDARACRDALPALEENGDIVVDSLVRDSGRPAVFAIGYRVTDAAGSRAGQLRCAFGNGPDGRRHLLGLELGGRPVGDARLYFLERFWLGDPAAINSGAARLDDRVPPLMLLAAVVGRPHPALLIALLAALLAGAALAGRRFSERLR